MVCVLCAVLCTAHNTQTIIKVLINVHLLVYELCECKC
jgi:hypothetical protein